MKINELATEVKLTPGTLYNWKVRKLIPNKCNFNDEDVKEIKKLKIKIENGVKPSQIASGKDLLSIRQMAEELDLPVEYLTAHIRLGNISKPTYQISLRYFYHPEEVSKIKEEYINYTKSENKIVLKNKERREAGFLSTTDLATLCGVRTISIQHHYRKDHIPRPTHTYQGCSRNCKYYTPKEVVLIKKFMDEQDKKSRRPWKDKK